MGLRKAAGTKPSMLAEKVPNVQEPMDINVPERLPTVKAQPSPEPTPSPMPAPSPTASEMPSVDAMYEVQSVDALAGLPSVDDLGDQPAFDINNFDFKILGRKGRVFEGKAQIFDEDKNQWVDPDNTMKIGASFMLDTLANAPAIAGGIGGGIAGGMIPLPASTAIGGILGASGAAGFNEEALAKMRQNPDLNKFITALEAVTGSAAEPMGPLKTAAFEVLGETIGGVLMRGGKKIAKQLGFAEEQAEQAFKESLPKVEQLTKSAERLGLDVKAADIAATMPGGGAFAEKQLMAEAGLLGQGVKTEYERQVNSQRDALVKVLQDAKKMVGGEAPAVAGSGIEATAKEGFEKNINIVDRYIDRWKKTLGQLREGVSETARQRRYDPTQLMSGVRKELAQLPGHEQFLSKDGIINMDALRSYAKNYLGSDQDAKLFVDQVALLQNIINKDSAFAKTMGPKLDVIEIPELTMPRTKTIAPEPGMGSLVPEFKPYEVVDPTRESFFRPKKSIVAEGTGIKSYDQLPATVAGEAVGGFTFDDISRIVDRFQELAVKTDNPRMKQLAGMALDYENTIMEKAYKDAGNESMAGIVKAAKEAFYNEIDGLESVRKRISDGITKGTLGDAILKMPPAEVRMFKSFLSPNELAEARMKAFNSAVLNEAIFNPSKTVNATYIQNKFLKDEKTRESMMELFGKDGFDNINAAFNVAKVLENKNLSPQAYVRVANDISGNLMKMEKKLGMIQYGKAIIGFLSGGNEKAADIIRQNISKYSEVAKPAKYPKAKLAAEKAVSAGEKIRGGSQTGKAIFLESLMQGGQPEGERSAQ